ARCSDGPAPGRRTAGRTPRRRPGRGSSRPRTPRPARAAPARSTAAGGGTRRRRTPDQPLIPHCAAPRHTGSMTTGAQTPHPARPRRSRLRTVLPLAVAAWLVLEIWLLTLLAGATNGLVVLLVLVAGLVLGSAVIKRAGRRAFKNLGETL